MPTTTTSVIMSKYLCHCTMIDIVVIAPTTLPQSLPFVMLGLNISNFQIIKHLYKTLHRTILTLCVSVSLWSWPETIATPSPPVSSSTTLPPVLLSMARETSKNALKTLNKVIWSPGKRKRINTHKISQALNKTAPDKAQWANTITWNKFQFSHLCLLQPLWLSRSMEHGL